MVESFQAELNSELLVLANIELWKKAYLEQSWFSKQNDKIAIKIEDFCKMISSFVVEK